MSFVRSLAVAIPFALSGGLAALASTVPTTYGGVTFPQGDISFADRVVAFAIGDGVGGTYDDPDAVLGAPDYNGITEVGSFALGAPGQSPIQLDDGSFGFVTVQFTDNSLTTSGDDSDDLFIFEIGARVEKFRVEISKDGSDWTTVAEDLGQPVLAIDIDAALNADRTFDAVSGEQFSFVRLTDVPGGQFSAGPRFAGPDIDAIGAISSGAPVDIDVVPLPSPALLLLGGLGLMAGLRKRS